jgi:hypothetical protein
MIAMFHFESFQEPSMILKSGFIAAVCTGVLALSGQALADDYRPDEYLGLDLSKAVLSPKRLGPPTQFAPVPVEAKTDRSGEAAQTRAEPKELQEPKTAERPTAVRTTRITAAHAESPKPSAHPAPRHVPARAKLARRHGNPLDAQARDTRIQTWPCRSGGICNWR